MEIKVVEINRFGVWVPIRDEDNMDGAVPAWETEGEAKNDIKLNYDAKKCRVTTYRRVEE